MKKIYNAPSIEQMQLVTEGVIAESIKVGTQPGGGMGTQGMGWNSEDWSDTDADIEE